MENQGFLFSPLHAYNSKIWINRKEFVYTKYLGRRGVMRARMEGEPLGSSKMPSEKKIIIK